MSGTATHCGEIEPHILYDLARFKSVTGNGEAAIRKMRRKGLKVSYLGRKGYIHGRDFIEFVQSSATATKPGSAL